MSRTINISKILIKRGTTAQNDAYTGLLGEVTLDTEKHVLRVHDGSTQGGFVTKFSGDYTALSNTPDLSVYQLASEAFSGDYNDLTNKPSATDLTGLATEAFVTSQGYITLAEVPVGFSGSYNDLADKPELFDGAYASLTGTPTIPADVSELTDTTNLLVHFSGDYNDLTNKPVLFSGAYADLTGKPTIPTLGNFTLSDNNIASSSGADPIVLSIFGSDNGDPLPALIDRQWTFGTDGSLNLPGSIDAYGAVNLKAYYGPPGIYREWSFDGRAGELTFPDSTIQTTAWTGTVSYNDLTDKPTIPADVSDLTDTTNLLDHFSGSYNDLTDKPTIPTVPTTVSSFTNDANYVASDTTGITGADQVTNMVTLTQAEYDAITPNASTVYFIVG